jgi:hypothetical protein
MSKCSRLVARCDRRSIAAAIGAVLDAMPRCSELNVDFIDSILEVVLPPEYSKVAFKRLEKVFEGSAFFAY